MEIKTENKMANISVEYSTCKFARKTFDELKKFDTKHNHLLLNVQEKNLMVWIYKHDDSFKDSISEIVFRTYIDHVINIINKFKTKNAVYNFEFNCI